MDADQVLRYVDGGNIEVVIVMVTGRPDHSKDKGLINRTYDHMVKPFDLDRLNSAVPTKVGLLRD